MTTTIAGIKIPDSALAKATTEYIRDIESDLLYHHSRRVFLFGALSGERKQLAYNPELLYVGAMFHDLGLVEGYRSDNERFEVDGANAAAAFLKPYGLSDDDIEQVWLSIALHTTPGVPQHLRPTVALVTAGVEMDVLGMDYAAFSSVQREAVVHAPADHVWQREDGCTGGSGAGVQTDELCRGDSPIALDLKCIKCERGLAHDC
jgi:hypothetical protein